MQKETGPPCSLNLHDLGHQLDRRMFFNPVDCSGFKVDFWPSWEGFLQKYAGAGMFADPGDQLTLLTA